MAGTRILKVYPGPCKKSKLRPRFIFPILVGWSNHSIPVGTKSVHRAETWWLGGNKSRSKLTFLAGSWVHLAGTRILIKCHPFVHKYCIVTIQIQCPVLYLSTVVGTCRWWMNSTRMFCSCVLDTDKSLVDGEKEAQPRGHARHGNADVLSLESAKIPPSQKGTVLVGRLHGVR